nr:Chain B, DNA mismatch repair protein Mlh1 NLS peptide [Homo sapiens]7M60_C Chain C, DNA mismatch repair protein Mlh1 NLS peptide [Homo sapiens]
SANPRKRHRED